VSSVVNKNKFVIIQRNFCKHQRKHQIYKPVVAENQEIGNFSPKQHQPLQPSDSNNLSAKNRLPFFVKIPVNTTNKNLSVKFSYKILCWYDNSDFSKKLKKYFF
jgi:hypothetical protein